MLCILIAYPIAYFIAFKVGRFKNILLGLVMIPFFTSFLLRTIAWQSLLADSARCCKVFKWFALRQRCSTRVGIMDNGALLQHAGGGDRRSHLQLPAVHAAADLRQPREDRRPPDGRRRPISTRRSDAAFTKVILPLSLPGVFAGTLLTFIPATGDFINAEFLGDTESKRVVGNAVRGQFLLQNDYPAAAAISFVLMAIITAIVAVYSKFLGTEDIA